MKHIAIWTLSFTAAVTTETAMAGPIDWARVDQAIGSSIMCVTVFT